MDALVLPQPDGLFWHQFSSDSNGGSSREYIARRGHLILFYVFIFRTPSIVQPVKP